MKWLALTLVALVSVLDCSTDYCLCGNDSGSGDVQGPLVSGGESCTSEGATAKGQAPICTDVLSTTTCTCNAGKWDCGKCPACANPIILGSGQCGFGEMCSGPTIAKQCDGTTTPVSGDCKCPGKGSGWTFDGVTTISFADAAADATTDGAVDGGDV